MNPDLLPLGLLPAGLAGAASIALHFSGRRRAALVAGGLFALLALGWVGVVLALYWDEPGALLRP